MLTIAALRSSSSSTTFLADSCVERHLDHAHGALDDLRASRDDRVRLLAAEHRVGDLGGVREVADAGLDDLDAGLLQPVLDLGLELLGDLGRVGAQRDSPSWCVS